MIQIATACPAYARRASICVDFGFFVGLSVVRDSVMRERGLGIVVVLSLARFWFGATWRVPKGSGSKPGAITTSPNAPVRKTVVRVPEGYFEERVRRGIDPFEEIDRNPHRFGVRGR